MAASSNARARSSSRRPMAAVCECPSARTRGARPDSTGACVTLARRLLRWLYHDYTHIGEALAGWCGGDVGAEQAHRGGSSVFTRGRTRNRRGLRVRKALPPRPTTLSTVRTARTGMHTDVRARNKKKDRHATNRGDVPRGSCWAVRCASSACAACSASPGAARHP